MKVGSLVYATEQGLGILAKAYWDHGILTDALVLRHHHRNTYPEWFPGCDVVEMRDVTAASRFCEGKDAMLFFETPFHWQLIEHCKRMGVKTIIMPMYECMPQRWPHQPDLIMCPSLIDLDYFGGILSSVPVEVPWRRRERAEVFVHNAGHGGLRNRNGTGIVLDAWRHVKSPAKLIIRSQKPLQWDPYSDLRIDIRVGSRSYSDLWRQGGEGDVFVFPDSFNGLSLPLQEAFAAGMLVMATDRYPANTWLPNAPLIPVAREQATRAAARCVEVQAAIVDPEALAAKVDAWYGQQIGSFSDLGREWADSNSWKWRKPVIRHTIREVINGNLRTR